MADHSFAPLTGRLRLRLVFDWVRIEIENTYRLHMQLGDNSALENTPLGADLNYLSDDGVGPSLAWAGLDQGMNTHEGLGYAVNAAISHLTTISGFTDVQVDYVII